VTGKTRSCGGAADGGGVFEVTGETENRKWFILTLSRLNYLSKQHPGKVTMQVSSLC